MELLINTRYFIHTIFFQAFPFSYYIIYNNWVTSSSFSCYPFSKSPIYFIFEILKSCIIPFKPFEKYRLFIAE